MTDLATILRTTEKNALVRAAKMDLLPVCERCGGCGRYSFNGQHSICYGCNGAGQRAPKAREMAAVIEAAKDAVASGKLDQYLELLAAHKRTRNARDIVMKAWKDTGISKMYRWQDATKPGRDKDISVINARMCRAYVTVEKMTFARTVDVLALDKAMSDALAEIAAADAELKLYINQP